MQKPAEKTILPKSELQKNCNHMELCNSFNTEYSYLTVEASVAHQVWLKGSLVLWMKMFTVTATDGW